MDSLSLSWLPGRGWSSALPVHLDSERTLVLAFGPADLCDSAEAIVDLREAFAESVCVGASSGIATRHGSAGALAVSITRFDQTRLGMVLDHPLHADADDARLCGRRMADALQIEPGLSAVLVFADRRSVNLVALMHGLADVLADSVALCDGMDGESARALGAPASAHAAPAQAGRAWVLAGGAPVEGVAVAVGLYARHARIDNGASHARVAVEPASTAF